MIPENKALNNTINYKVNSHEVAYYENGSHIDPNTTDKNEILTAHSNCPDISFWYINTLFYSNGYAKKQIAYSYTSDDMYTRYYKQDIGWSDWTPIMEIHRKRF